MQLSVPNRFVDILDSLAKVSLINEERRNKFLPPFLVDWVIDPLTFKGDHFHCPLNLVYKFFSMSFQYRL